MCALYDGLTRGGVIVLESPTGTGKSLSLTCATLTWLMDNRGSILASKLRNNEADHDSGSDDEHVPAWLQKQSDDCSHRRARELLDQWNQQKLALRDKVSKMGLLSESGSNLVSFSNHKKRKKDVTIQDGEDLADIHPVMNSPEDGTMRDIRPRIFFCSRTHSQISQLIREIRKTHFAESLNMVTLSSRRQTCINNSIIDFGETDAATVDDGCRKLVESSKCDFFTGAEKLSMILSDKLKDIEDQYSDGSRLGACPYYASRHSAKSADVVLVPYTSILSESMRQSLDIDVKGNIVVIDEAHNLIDALSTTLTIRLNQQSLESASLHLTEYSRTYAAVLAPRNLVSIKKLGFLIKSLLSWICSIGSDSLCTVQSLMKCAKIDSSDLGSVSLFLETTDFKRKLRGFVDRTEEGSLSGAVYTLHTLFQRLQHSSEWDRISVRVNGASRELCYVVIDCVSALARLVKQARAVVLAGGTMKPLDEYRAIAESVGVPFTSYVASLTVGRDRLFAGVISKSSEGTELLFTHQHRSSQHNLNSLREIVCNVFESAPRGGVIMFVTSYEYAQEVSNLICDPDVSRSFTVVCDRRGAKPSDTLRGYREHIAKGSPVLLISVISGTLSEGIDFRDELCRCVMIVGLPYPNQNDPVLLERMKYCDAKHREHASSPDGNRFYHISCMRAVNQSIGRAIRHSRDWASVLLIDARYNRPDIKGLLSDWIRGSVVSQNIESLTCTLRPFFTEAARVQI